MLNWRCFDIKFSFEDNNHCFKFLRNLQIILSLQKVENKKLYPETYVWKYLIWICGSLKLDIKSDNSGASFENGKILFLTSNCILTRLNIQQWSIYLIWMLHFATLVTILLSVPSQTLWQLSWPVTWCCALDWAPLTRDHESWSADDRQPLTNIVTREDVISGHQIIRCVMCHLNLSGVMSALSRGPGNLQARLQKGIWWDQSPDSVHLNKILDDI